jgi:hypothetical protein
LYLEIEQRMILSERWKERPEENLRGTKVLYFRVGSRLLLSQSHHIHFPQPMSRQEGGAVLHLSTLMNDCIPFKLLNLLKTFSVSYGRLNILDLEIEFQA